MESLVKDSIFPNMPPFITGVPSSETMQSKIPTEINGITMRKKKKDLISEEFMVEQRNSLWRIPNALRHLVQIVHSNRKEKHCFENSNLNIPDAFTKDKNISASNRRSFRPKSQNLDNGPGVLMNSNCLESPSIYNKLPKHFNNNHNDGKSFTEEHSGVKISPFPLCHEIARKDLLFKHFKAMRSKHGRKEFDFLKETFNLPEERRALEKCMISEPDTLWIIKPPGGNNGTGIRVIKEIKQVPNTDEALCVQKYINNPYLINQTKFDIRIYVLITSLNPLRIYMYEDGLVRFATSKYNLNLDELDNSRIHVTNYAINKDADNFVSNETPDSTSGHKWTLSSFWNYLAENRNINTDKNIFTVSSDIEDVIIKSVLCGLESIRAEVDIGSLLSQNSNYNFYKLLGYDILLDSDLKPHLIEINARPAALHDTLDAFVNRPMLKEMVDIIGYHIPPSCASRSSKDITRRLLNIEKKYRVLDFQHQFYSRSLKSEDILKQNDYPRAVKDRDTYIHTIAEKLTGADVRILIKSVEEFHKCKGFVRVFPTRDSHKYFEYFDRLPYYDKLLDGFLYKYRDNWDEGVQLLKDCCRNLMHF